MGFQALMSFLCFDTFFCSQQNPALFSCNCKFNDVFIKNISKNLTLAPGNHIIYFYRITDI
jgi:hypothetical protein